MKLFLFLSLQFFITSLFAGDLGPEDKFLIMSVDEETDVSPLKQPNTKVLEEPVKKYKSNLLSIQVRDSVFKKSGLQKSVENWDDFEKDSLAIKLSKPGSESIYRIMNKNPELTRPALEKAQRLIQEMEK